jgi:hypothetical protein
MPGANAVDDAKCDFRAYIHFIVIAWRLHLAREGSGPVPIAF